MVDELKKAVTVDDVVRIHGDFLDACLRECLLTNHDLVKVCSVFLLLLLLFTMMLMHATPLLAAVDATSESVPDVLQLDRPRVVNHRGCHHATARAKERYCFCRAITAHILVCSCLCVFLPPPPSLHKACACGVPQVWAKVHLQWRGRLF